MVGVCASGKTTLSETLRPWGIPVHPVAQEHSQVARLYRRLGPRPLVLLVASWETVHRRRTFSFEPQFFTTEWERLADARREANLVVHTDGLSPDEVAKVVADWWDRERGIRAGPGSAGAEPRLKAAWAADGIDRRSGERYN